MKRSGILFVLLFLLLAGSSWAQYPTKPIQIIVPFPPGGGADVTARLVTDKVSAFLGQPVVVVNKSGGGGVIGTYSVKAAPADGYTILQIPSPFIMAPLVTKGVAYSPTEDFIPISMAAHAPVVLAVKKEARWQKLEDLISEAKRNPGKITCGITGYGAGTHFTAEMFKMQTDIEVNLIPLDGTAGTVSGILGGHVDFTPPEVAGVVYNQLVAGSMRSLAILSEKRHKDFPNVPTTVEIGYPQMLKISWHGFVVRTGTPRNIVEKLEQAFQEALKDKEIIGMFEKNGMVVDNLGTQGAIKLLADEHKRWSEIAKTAKIVPK
jgi:tripartite-type tricarboxylate transporter receptor subunit TctC